MGVLDSVRRKLGNGLNKPCENKTPGSTEYWIRPSTESSASRKSSFGFLIPLGAFLKSLNTQLVQCPTGFKTNLQKTILAA